MGIPYDSNPFDVSPPELKERLRELQRIIHPDKWSVKGPDAQELAVELSGLVNKAYTTLLNPYTRAEYIMQLEGIEIGETDSLEDPDLIMEVMEARERLESAESREEVDEIQVENQDRIEELLPELSDGIARKDWDSVKSNTIKLKYLQGIDAAADAWPSSLHDH